MSIGAHDKARQMAGIVEVSNRLLGELMSVVDANAPTLHLQRPWQLPWGFSARATSLAGPVLVLLVAIGVHWPDLSGLYSSNPLFIVSGLARQWSGGVLEGQPGWIDLHAGATRQSLGSLAAWDWVHGVIPWWNPYEGVGLPLAAQPQSSALFLPFVLLEHFFNGTAYLKIAMQVIAGQATYRLLRHLALARTASVLGAILYELNGTFAWFGDAPMLPIAFLPLIVLGIEQARRASRQGRQGGWALIGLGIAYSVLAGFPETAYLGGIFALAWATLRFYAEERHRVRFAMKVAMGGIAGLLIAAPLLLGFAEYLAQAWHQPRDMAHVGLLGPNYAMYLFPYVFGPIFHQKRYDIWFNMGGYVGLCPVLLSIAALIGTSKDRSLRYLLAASIAIALAKSAALPGITDLVNLWPGIGQVMAVRYLAPTIAFAMCVLAAFAIDDCQTRLAPRPRVTAAVALAGTAVAVIAVLGASTGLLALLWAQPAYRLWPVLSVTAPVVLCVVLAGLLAYRWSRAPVAVATLAIIESAVLFTIPLLSGAAVHRIDRAPVDFLRANLGLQRFYAIGPVGPNYGAYFQVAQVNHNYLPLAESWANYVVGNLDPGISPNVFNGTHPDLPARLNALSTRLAAYEAVGVRYVVAYSFVNPFPALAGPIPRKAFSDDLVSIYELPHPAPYFSTRAGLCTLRDEGRQRVHATCRAPDTLVRRELLYPGWTATVNDAPAVLDVSDQVFQSLRLPAGQTTIRFKYAPPNIGYACAACLVGMALVFLSLLRGTNVCKRRWIRSGTG